jgi:hypothetical protein
MNGTLRITKVVPNFSWIKKDYGNLTFLLMTSPIQVLLLRQLKK